MSCSTCGGRGFVNHTGDFKSKYSDTVFKDIEFVNRCPEYVDYFRNRSVNEKPVWNARLCDYALKTHQECYDHIHKKEDRRKRHV